MSPCHFVHDKVALGQVFLRVHQFYLISHIPPTVRVNTVLQKYNSTSLGVLRRNLRKEQMDCTEEARLNMPTLSIIHIH